MQAHKEQETAAQTIDEARAEVGGLRVDGDSDDDHLILLLEWI